MIAAPVSLTIDLDVVAKACPPALEARLNSKTSPPPSPKQVGDVQTVTPPSSPQKAAAAQKLHEAHLQVCARLTH